MKPNCLIFLVLLFSVHALFGQEQPQIHHANGQFSLKNEPSLTPHAKASQKLYWNYFWEFGDGHFSTEKAPRHVYKTNRTYPVRLHLTPYYAVGKYKIIAGQATNPKLGNAVYDDFNGYIAMQSSANHEKNNADLVPGNAYEFVVQIKAPADMTQNGYLFLFYNKFGEVGTIPFEKVIDQRPYIGGKNVLDPKTLLNGSVPQSLKMYANSYRDVLGFEVFRLKRDEQRNFFFTIKSHQALDKFQDKDIKLKLRACWLPTGLTSTGKVESMEYNLEILAIHDPNRLVADRTTQYFRKNNQPTINYTLQFQNEEKGIVNKVKAVVNLEPGLDANTVNIIKTDMDNYPPCNGDTTRPCYRLEKMPDDNKFTIHFHEIGLEGKDSKRLLESKKSTKAKVYFSVDGSPKREAVSKATAAIHFDKVPEVVTPKEKINWRIKSLYLRGGLNFNEKANTYSAGSGQEGASDRPWSLGISYQNAPLGEGFSRGIDASFSRFQFHKQALVNLSTDPNNVPTEFLFVRERMDLKVFDLRYNIGYQPTGFLKVFAAAGIALPAWGKVYLDGWFDPVFASGIEATLTDEEVLDFAYWRQDDPVDFMGEEINTPSNLPGLSTQIGFEVGLLNDLSIGGAYEVRRLNKSYNNECLTITNLTLYAKLRLFRM